MLLLIIKYQKKIAFILALLFSLDILSPAIVSASTPMPFYFYKSIKTNDGWGLFQGRKPKTAFSMLRQDNTIELPLNDPAAGAGKMAGPVIETDKKSDIDGPGQPEMKSFQSVNADNMVDLFTGDFSYNIPLLDVGGYPVSLHYNGGINMDQESSWVGLGWNINPGSISRSMRGLPDDFDGVNDSLRKTQYIKENKTTGVTLEPSLEVWSMPMDVSARLGVFYNSYNGYGLETGVGIGGTAKSSFGSLTGNLSISNNSQEGIRVSPSLNATFGKYNAVGTLHGTLGISTGYSSRGGISSLQINGGVQRDELETKKGKEPGFNVNYPFATISFARPAYSPSVNMPLSNHAYSFTGKIGGAFWGTHASIGFTGYVNKQEIAVEDRTQSVPAAGYLYSTYANGKENVILDFNREKDMEFNYKTTPHIAIPQYTYDAFSISGEGIAGSFRPYRGDIGYVFDHNIASRSSSSNGSIDVGFGSYAHFGLEVTNTTTNTTNHRWNHSNNIEPKLGFTMPDTTYEAVYFRNPGEKTINDQQYYRSIGDDSLVRIKLAGSKSSVYAESALVKYTDEGRPDAEIQVTSPIVKKQRDKRTQVISYLTAEDASILGLDKKIKSYKENTVPVGTCPDSLTEIDRVDNKVRKKNHLSEISVLNSDGRKYVYGLPIYNVVQQDVTFAINDTGNSKTGLVKYGSSDNAPENGNGKDSYYSKEEMPAYAHNFLLTGILSPDYVDLTGNGITEDDPGDAIKFNYTEVYGANNGYYQWRTPFAADSANYNEGFKTYQRDNKATYLYGEKEMWYLNSIESKTMIAVFYIKNDRQDAYAVTDENGGANTGKAARRLDSINLYLKADIIRNGINSARPVKTVHFYYNYELCKGWQGHSSTGKLTLKKVWFTYNKNNKGELNPYVFNYSPGDDDVPQAEFNPSFNSRNVDRWGTYKSSSQNEYGINNADFPYSLQDSAKAAKNVTAWNLTDIKLPSGGKMKITYESDDYAYVQNKRATQMTFIAGINQSAGNALYNGSTEYYTVYINTPDVLKNKTDLRNKYLDLDNVLYYKLAVKMPQTSSPNTFEMVPGYGTIEDYGITPGNNKQFWVRLAPVEGKSPFVRSALQFLRLNLPSKAYPNSEGIANLDFENLVKMLATSFSEIKNMTEGFDGAAKDRSWCRTIDLEHSFVRLSSPNYKKYGGGYRVKRVQIFDNWKKMTDQRESVYGQEYSYTTTEDVDGVQKTISSGVATYEPAIGGEENPFRRPLNYIEKVAPMAPVNFMFSEEPLCESFFPSPMIGYSKVRVRTINAKARSANGWQETEYYTSRDFPTLVENTPLEEGRSKFKYETASNILRLNHKNYVTISQGFKVELNDMNGKMKAQSNYAETDSLHPIAFTQNFYKVDDDKSTLKHLNNEVWTVDSTTGVVNIHGQIGKDIEVMTDLREQDSKANTLGFSPNVEVMPIPFLPLVLYAPRAVNLPQKEEVRYRSAAIMKVVQRYGILDSVVVMDKGSVVSTKNMVYDAETGNVLLSRTNNEFNDPIYNFNYPAYWAYSGMQPAYKNIGAVFFGNRFGSLGFQLNKGRLYKSGSIDPFPVERFFESGDELYVYNATLAEEGMDCRYLNSIPNSSWKGRLWVMDAAKGNEQDKGLYFIDSLGRIPPSMLIGKMMIVRSGKRNMQDVSAGSVVMLSNPVKEVTEGNFRIVIDSTTKVLNASAATFKDMWKVENAQYQEDSCYTMIKSVYGAKFYPLSNKEGNSITNLREIVYVKRRKIHDNFPIPNIESSNYATSSRKAHTSGNKHLRYSIRSVARFDINNVLKTTDSVTSAILYLNGGAPVSIWNGIDNDDVNYFKQKTKAHYQTGELYERTNSSNIRQVIGAWNINTGINTLLTSSIAATVTEAPDNSCNSKTPDVTLMVRDMVKNPGRNNGFVLSLDDLTGGIDNDHSSERTLGFCGGFYEGLSSDNCVFCNNSYLSIDYITRKDTCVKICRNYISDTATNPYRWGILGNWRMDKSYVYYNSRQETDATIKNTNIRVEGLLKDFVPYWSFAPVAIQPNEDTTRWVWNSVIDKFNRKGFEIENHDPLGRYNAGLYGYNQTLPVAVAQNSRYQELLYDGFEDYGYKTNYCATCTPEREFDFIKDNTGVDTTTSQSHTGLYSLKVNSGSESLVSVPIVSDTANTAIAVVAAIDSAEVYNNGVVGAGEGLTGTYTMGTQIAFIGCYPISVTGNRVDPTIDFDWSSSIPMTPGSGGCSNAYLVSWTGTIQPRYTDRYTFYLTYNGTATIWIGNTKVYEQADVHYGEGQSPYTIDLQAGHLYPISITYYKKDKVSPGDVKLSWSSEVGQQKEVVPSSLLYPEAPAFADTAGSIQPPSLYYCVSGDTVTPKHVIREKFSPFTNTKLTVSAWVRLDVDDCNNTPALDSVIQVSFSSGGTSVWLKKTGLRIEGWQRYEANINTPADPTTMQLHLKTLADVGIYVDDIRVQPFNSSMKSFVYNPVNLRLMAELDENNYASFYEYDDDGTLIRVKKETERGIMTIQETRSALHKE